MQRGSKLSATVAIRLAMSASREEEAQLKEQYAAEFGIRCAAVDFGGDFISSVSKIVERAVVAAKREGVITDAHVGEGAIAGATRDALAQIMNKAIGLNVGGKIGMAHYVDHVAVAIFSEIGLLHLDEIAIGLAHRAVQ
jgi:hypothetical protein